MYLDTFVYNTLQINELEEMHMTNNYKKLSSAQYRVLQKLGAFDRKTTSRIQAPDNIRKLGGALFYDRRYDTVFVYHNGAESYYEARGSRASLKV